MKPLGKHLLIELNNCDTEVLKDLTHLEKAMNRSAKAGGANIVDSNFHAFSPYGISGVIIIKESHLTIHTWPEHQYAAVDLFSCSGKIDADKIIAVLKEELMAENVIIEDVERGYGTSRNKS
ncbi:MAG: adenosylmethionine decarboxylase [Flavobacteriales bacterium]